MKAQRQQTPEFSSAKNTRITVVMEVRTEQLTEIIEKLKKSTTINFLWWWKNELPKLRN